MRTSKLTYILLAVLAVASIATHFAFWGYPHEVVFDEVHFGNFSLSYQQGTYYFDIHPPLGKLLIGAMGEAGGMDPGQDFTAIGKPYVNPNYVYLRLLPILAGTLLPLALFLLCLRLGFSHAAAFLVGLGIVFENSLLANSRFILMDNLLLLFGFGALLVYLASDDRKGMVRTGGRLAAAVLATAALSIKWTGATFWFLILCIEAWRFFSRRERRDWRSVTSAFATFIAVPFAIYYAIIAAHFSMLPHSGPGDAFMTAGFQKTLKGSAFAAADVRPIGEWEKFLELNRVMFTANQSLSGGHPDASRWYMWPFMQRPIFFWQGTASSPEVAPPKIYLLGNPLVYWLALGGIIALAVFLLDDMSHQRKRRRLRFRAGLFIAAGYVVNFVPFAFIDRPMFLYHYFVSLIFAIMALAWIVDRVREERAKWMTVAAILAAWAVVFVYFAPLTYGLPLSRSAEDQRFWFESWR